MSSRIVRPESAFNTSRRAKETPALRAPNHLAWIGTLPSAISGRMGCEAAHVSFADRRFGKPERGKSTKADDNWTLPLTPDEHRDQHACKHGGERDWWLARGIDATTLASRMWAVSGDSESAIEILNQSRIEAAAELRRRRL